MALVEEYIVKIIHRVSIDRPGNPGFVSNYKGVGSLQDESSRIITDFADEKERFRERICCYLKERKNGAFDIFHYFYNREHIYWHELL